jgi:hypothetical protein
MTMANSYPVGYALTPVGRGNDPYDPSVKWAQPDLDEAVELMRRVVEDPQEARERAAAGRADIAYRFSPEVCGRKMATRIAEIRSRP